MRRSRTGAALLGAALATAAAGRVAHGSLAGGRQATLVLAQYPVRSVRGGTAHPGFGEGGRLLLVTPGGRTRVLSAGFHSAADPEVSFDGKSILFAAKLAASDPWCIFETKADGAQEPRKITCGAAGARQPIYLPTIYTITPVDVEPWVQIAFVGEDPGERDEQGLAPHTSLWSCKTDGTALRRLTFNLSNDTDPAVLPDGRVVYAAWLRRPGARDTRVPIVGVNADGTDYQLYAGDEGLRVKRMPAPTAAGLVVFVESSELEGDGAGRLASVSQRRPLHSHRAISGEADGFFHSPSPLPDGRVLVSWRASGGDGSYGVYRLDPASRARETAFDDPAWHDLQAKLVAPRPTPDARSSVVRDDDPEGKLYTIDVHIQEPARALRPGTAKSLRVVEGVPASAERTVSRRLLGEVEIADDGSYQVQIPANTPVQLELIGANGMPLRTSAWLWVRNHAAQGCVGCHEDPERTPPNRLMKALSSPAPVLHSPPDERRPLTDAHAPSAGGRP